MGREQTRLHRAFFRIMPKIHRILLLFYKVCYVIGPVLLLFLRLYAYLSPKRRRRLEAQFSPPAPPWKDVCKDVPVLWVHALSVGEVKAAMPLVEGIFSKWPHVRVLLSASTATGMDTWKSWLGDHVNQGVADRGVFLIPAPLDFPCIIRRFRRMYAPVCMIFVETDLWPNWIWDFRDNGIPSILVNGAISSRSAKRLEYFKPLARLIYEGLEVISMQSQEDRMRLLKLGLPENRILVLGNLKKAARTHGLSHEKRSALRRAIGLREERLWVAGSTHETEDAVCLKAHAGLLKSFPGLKCVLAPRDVKRAAEIQRLARSNGLVSCLRSTFDGKTAYDVLILDTLGELADIYALADVAFVGGSLVPVGGHNLLEPAVHGVPVLFGRYVESCAEWARTLLEYEGGFECDEDSLEGLLLTLLKNDDMRKRVGEQAQKAAGLNANVMDRHLKLIESVLKHAGFC